MYQPLQMNFLQVKELADQWCEEAGIDRGDTWHYPFEPEAAMTVVQVLWRFIEEGRMTTLTGMRGYFDRYLRTRQARQPEIPLAERGTLEGTRPFSLLR